MTLVEDAKSAAKLSTAGFIVGGVGLAAGVALFVTSLGDTEQTAAARIVVRLPSARPAAGWRSTAASDARPLRRTAAVAAATAAAAAAGPVAGQPPCPGARDAPLPGERTSPSITNSTRRFFARLGSVPSATGLSTEALRREPTRADALLDKVVPNRLCALLAQLLVQLGRAGLVGVPLHPQLARSRGSLS